MGRTDRVVHKLIDVRGCKQMLADRLLQAHALTYIKDVVLKALVILSLLTTHDQGLALPMGLDACFLESS